MRTFIAILACIGVASAAANLRTKIRSRRQGDVFTLSFGGGSGGSSSGCTDTRSDCSQYEKSMCTDSKYQQWVQDNCCAYCQTGGSSVPSAGMMSPSTGSGSCSDKISNCEAYTQSVCTNPDFSQWVSQNCPKFCNKCSGGSSGGQVFQPATYAPVSPGGSSSGSCMDKQPDCASYGQSVCTNSQYSQWVMDNCPKYCGKCGSSSGSMPMPSSGGSSSCQDVSSNCAMLNQASHICSDAGAKLYAQQNCARTCNMCSSSSGSMMPSGGSSGSSSRCSSYQRNNSVPVLEVSCTDSLSNCELYGRDMCSNSNYAQWAKENCAKYCGLCSSSGGSMPVPSGGNTGNTMGGNTGGNTGGSFTGSTSGCYYKNKLHQQGETWQDGCDYECTCVDGSSGRYSCTSLCVTWNLPSACHMNPPQSGLCCPTPSCPAGYQIKYPDNYTPK